MDYIRRSREAAHLDTSFTILPFPIGADHAPLSLSFASSSSTYTPSTYTPHTAMYFTHDVRDVYSHQIYEGVHHMDPSAPLGVLTS